MNTVLDEELRTYEGRKPELLGTAKGKFVLIEVEVPANFTSFQLHA